MTSTEAEAPRGGTLLQDGVAVVTGGASGIGRAICERFALAGARAVVVADRQAEPREGGASTVELVRQAGAEAVFVETDVRDPAQAERAVAAADDFGGIDVLVTAAGIARRGSTLEVSEADYDAVMDVNAKGTFFAAQAAVRRMRGTGSGSLVLISSTGGIKGNSDIAVYTMSKGAVRLLAYSLAAEFGADGVRVNALHPGLTETEMTRTDLGRVDTGSVSQSRIPLGRTGQPGDIADAAVFLASPMSAFVHGSSLVVDGGSTWAS
ncbi:SDR family oxidoreductase [Actinomycetospora endophytica]|uniref:SDR family oxidoreductase n=1 Tax=Actinomycetospora endophytica TaxID=2291215 RepID=A0ABS8PI99_9PSEU|nr:SDR family oxidoreductase [Actinomycetospora endophytica]MCD2197980.1 SDR family oxidoreductase [Actinomycetospora endophytica]